LTLQWPGPLPTASLGKHGAALQLPSGKGCATPLFMGYESRSGEVWVMSDTGAELLSDARGPNSRLAGKHKGRVKPTLHCC